ncbi:MAG TPA: phosphoesterase, partial [Salinimicrobium sp.]|nr:phosphoesterase [Salinimicrobium sp.]
YNSFVDRLSTISLQWGRVIFAGGHDHSLQFNDNGLIKQIVSGSGGINAYARDSKNGFSSEEKGFAVLDIYKDGSSRVKFYAAEASKPEFLHENLIYPAVDSLEVSDLPEEFPEFETAAIYSEEETEKSDFYEFLWGERYRDLYSKKIKVPVADLSELYGGLEPMRLGGGHQTNSIRLKDSLDREYNIRMLRKDAVQFLQTTAYKDKVVEKAFKGTFAERMIQDFYTASHPYAYLAVAPLAEAADIHHTNPEIYFMPNQPELGEYNASHGGEIYMIEERPEENWLGYESFGSPNHDIESTSGMFDRLRRDEKYNVDEEAYVRARIFDMLVGDWDRHADQWRWAEIELENGDRIFEPIPRDRDQAFSNFDGFLFENLRKIISFFNQFGDYDEDINDIEMFNRSANSMDRSIIQTSGKEVWVEQAEFLQNAITNEVIKKAFDTLPEAIQGESTQQLIDQLKARRENLRDIALEYYEELSELAWMSGTDKDDFIDINRLGNGQTKVSISRNKDGKRGELMKEKTFNAEETDEVWIYALDDDDQIFVNGAGSADIDIKIIGGQNNDVYNIENGKGIKIYDHRSKPNTIKSKNGAKVYLTDNYKINTFDPNFRISESGGILPYFGYNPDDGVILGISNTSTTTGLVRKPFTTQHKISAGYFFGTKGFEVAYSGEFAHPTNSYNLFVGAHYSSPHNSRNFFGLGNETHNFMEELGKDYNRTRISEYGADIGLVRRGQYGSTFKYSLVGESVKVEETPGRFLDIAFPELVGFYDRMFFAGLQAEYSYESYDSYINPSKGLNFNVSTGGKMNIENPDKHFLFLNPYLELFTPL